MPAPACVERTPLTRRDLPPFNQIALPRPRARKRPKQAQTNRCAPSLAGRAGVSS